MFKTIMLEFMKWKRSKVLFAAFAASLITPFVAMVSAHAKMQDPKLGADWDSYFGVAMQLNLSLIFPILFGGLTAYVFVQEYQDKTIINLFTLPQSRTKILFAKLSSVIGTLFILIVISTILIFIGGIIVLKQPLTFYVLIRHTRLSIISGIMALCFIPIFSYIGIKTRHFIPPLVGATGFTFLNFAFLASPKFGVYVPTAIPVFYVLKAIGWLETQLPFVWTLLLPVFFITLYVCIKEYSVQDIH